MCSLVDIEFSFCYFVFSDNDDATPWKSNATGFAQKEPSSSTTGRDPKRIDFKTLVILRPHMVRACVCVCVLVHVCICAPIFSLSSKRQRKAEIIPRPQHFHTGMSGDQTAQPKPAPHCCHLHPAACNRNNRSRRRASNTSPTSSNAPNGRPWCTQLPDARGRSPLCRKLMHELRDRICRESGLQSCKSSSSARIDC